MKQTTDYNQFPECCKRCVFKKSTVHEWGRTGVGYIHEDVYSCRKNIFLPTKKQQCKKHKLTKKYRFIKFLKDKHIDRIYLSNWDTKRRIKPFNYILDPFEWSKTIQGREFWRRINSKWLEILLEEYGE